MTGNVQFVDGMDSWACVVDLSVMLQ